jgi:hypothetical protein
MGVLIGVRSESYAASNKWLTLLAGGDFDPSLIVEPPQLGHAPLSEFEAMRRAVSEFWSARRRVFLSFFSTQGVLRGGTGRAPPSAALSYRMS